jgi:hypothetical protein
MHYKHVTKTSPHFHTLLEYQSSATSSAGNSLLSKRFFNSDRGSIFIQRQTEPSRTAWLMKRNRYPQENYKVNYGKCWTAMGKGLAVAAVTMGLAAGSLANQGPRVLITTPIDEAQLVTLVDPTISAQVHM